MTTNWQRYRASGERALNQGRLEEAESMWLAALEETEDFSEDDPRRATTLEGLAEACFRQGKHANAEQCCRQVLQIYEKALGPAHPDVGVTANNLAMLLHAQKKYAEAEPLYKRALSIRTKALGKDHPDVSRLLDSYADLLVKTNRPDEARQLKENIDAFASGRWTRSGTWKAAQPPPIQVAAGGRPGSAPGPGVAPVSPPGSVSGSRQQAPAPAAVSHHGLGGMPAQPPSRPPDPKVSLPPHVQSALASSVANASYQERMPVEEPIWSKNWKAYKDFAEEAVRRGLFSVAEVQWSAAVKEAENFGEQNPRLAYTLDNLADTLCRLRKFEDAEPVLDRCITMKTNAIGENHVTVAMTISNLARLHYAQKNYSKAESLLFDVIRIYENVFGEEHVETASALYNLALIYHQQSRFIEAEPVYKRCWQIRKKLLGEEHPDTLKVRDNYSKVLQIKQKAMAEAERQKTSAKYAAYANAAEQQITGSWRVLELPQEMQLGSRDENQ